MCVCGGRIRISELPSMWVCLRKTASCQVSQQLALPAHHWTPNAASSPQDTLGEEGHGGASRLPPIATSLGCQLWGQAGLLGPPFQSWGWSTLRRPGLSMC